MQSLTPIKQLNSIIKKLRVYSTKMHQDYNILRHTQDPQNIQAQPLDTEGLENRSVPNKDTVEHRLPLPSDFTLLATKPYQYNFSVPAAWLDTCEYSTHHNKPTGSKKLKNTWIGPTQGRLRSTTNDRKGGAEGAHHII